MISLQLLVWPYNKTKHFPAPATLQGLGDPESKLYPLKVYKQHIIKTDKQLAKKRLSKCLKEPKKEYCKHYKMNSKT